jgi:hypothetical protein
LAKETKNAIRVKTGWIEDVRDALLASGGEAHLSAIYPKVRGQRTSRGAPLGQYKAWVRYFLQQNSRGKGRDIFVHVGPGRWRLK